MSYGRIIHILFDEQAVCRRSTQIEKYLLVTLFKKQRQKRPKMGFLHVTPESSMDGKISSCILNWNFFFQTDSFK